MTTPHNYGKDSVFPPRVVFTDAEQVIARRKESKQARMERQLANMSPELRNLLTGGEASPDPWVVVGTTTIDGTIKQVAEALLYGHATNDVENNVGWIDSMVSTSDRKPWEIGGRHLRARGSHINLATNTAIIRCDIVRRQSEIDAEARLRPCVNCEDAPVDAGGTFCEGCTADLRATEVRPQCHECGPHGNRGEVLLASSWARCTTCAGGKPGDLWGEVKLSEEPKYWSSVANKMVTFAEALALGRSHRRPEDEM